MKANQSKSNKPLAMITGASSGIGYELAILFAKAGYDLVIIADNDAIQESAISLRSMGTDITAIQADLSKLENTTSVANEVLSYGRPLAALVLNAGVGAAGEFLGSHSLDKDLNLINLNVISVVAMSKLLLPMMVTVGEGRVMVTSSIASVSPGPYNAVYHASKAFVQSFAEAIREELKDSGVTVTSLMPGATETQFFAHADMLDTKVGQAKKDDAAQVAQQGFDAMMRGIGHVIAGSFMNKVEGVVSKLVPDNVKAKQTKPQNQPLEPGDEKSVDAIEMLTRQHREAEDLFERIEHSDTEQAAVFKILATKLLEHMMIEEDVFYPAASKVNKAEITHARGEHDSVKDLIAALLNSSYKPEKFSAMLAKLKKEIFDHVQEEEDDLFPQCQQAFDKDELISLADEMRDLLVDMDALGALWHRESKIRPSTTKDIGDIHIS